MNKRALLVGINRYKMAGNNLKGCVNDVTNIRDILIRFYGFKVEDIRVVVDERATKNNIIIRLKWLVTDSKVGDKLLFHYSGHGCFSGDTKISLLDGTEKSFEELVRDYSDREFWVYSCDKKGNIKPGRAHSPRITKLCSSILKIILDNGEIIKCTPDHLFLLKNGIYKEARLLTVEDSLMPLYRSICNDGWYSGYEYCITGKKKTKFTHIAISPEKKGMCSICGDIISKSHSVRHHINFNKLDNRPENIQWVTSSEHTKIHIQAEGQTKIGQIGQTNKDSSLNIKRIKTKKEKALNDPEYAQRAFGGLTKIRNNLEIEKLRLLNLRKAIKEREYTLAMKQAFQSIPRNLGNHNRWHKGIDFNSCSKCNPSNHKIISLEYLNESIPVYDITVEEYNNFALTSGVFVHNSQIRDRNGDELSDGLDELLCPHDMNFDGNYILDDDLKSILSKLPVGVNLDVILDCCHSGTGTREFSPFEPTGDCKARYLEPPIDILLRNDENDELPVQKILKPCSKAVENGVTTMTHNLIAGCKDNQTAADALINNTYNGALTYYLCKIIRETRGIITRNELINRVQTSLRYNKYRQIPQLEGPGKEKKFLDL